MSLEALPEARSGAISETGVGTTTRKSPLISYETVTLFLPSVDVALVLAAAIIAPILIALFMEPPSPSVMKSLDGLALVASGVYAFRMRDVGHYEIQSVRSNRIELRAILQAWAASILVMLVLVYMFQLGEMSTRHSFTVFVALAPVLLISWRATVKAGLRYAASAQAVGRSDVLLVGETDELRQLDADGLLGHYGISNVARFPIEGGSDAALGPEDIASLSKAIEFARNSGTREVFVVASWSHTKRLGEVREMLQSLPIAARLLPDSQIRALAAYPAFSDGPAFEVELQREPLTSLERAIKRTFDVVLATGLLVVLSPLMLGAMLAIRLESPGPAVFRQRRVGFNRQEFVIYKFRTMRVLEDGTAVRQAMRDDDRITKVGRFLRATSIDELPQLLNVINGTMSLVGPRPHALAHDYEFERRLAAYAFRRHVKPGITGWAQCKGRRGPTPTVEDVRARMELDLWYITNWSFSLDLYIMMRTAVVMLGQKNAF